MNGPINEVQTWVDLLSKEAGVKNESVNNGGAGIVVTSQIPRPTATRKSRLKEGRAGDKRGQKGGQLEVLRSQVVSLLKEKQELMKKAQFEKRSRESLEEELKLSKANKENTSHNGPVDCSGNTVTTSLKLQVSTLREALDAVTHEKNLLKHQLSARDKGHSSSFMGNADSSSITTEEDFSLRLQLSQLQDNLYRVEHERDALKERLTGMEAHRQLSMEQYQQEVESSMMEVTNQLEELLQLNQQLQKELTSLQQEKEDLSTSLQRERDNRRTWEKEKIIPHHQLQSFEEQTEKLNDELQQVKDEMLQQTTSSLAAIETLQSQIAESNESSGRMKARNNSTQLEIQRLNEESKQKEKNLEEADHALLDLQHRLTLVRQERDSFSARLESSQAQVAKLKKEKKVNEEENVKIHSNASKLQTEKEVSYTELASMRGQLELKEEDCGRLKKEMSVSQKHCKQQVENLTQQLIHKTQQFTGLDIDNSQLQSRVKKLEGKIHEMALNHEISSSKLEGDMRTMMSNLDSTLSQLETTESSNTQLQQKILDLEEEVAGWRKQLTDREGVCQEMRELVEGKNSRIQELENTITKLHQDVTHASANNDDHTQTLLSQIQSLKESIKQLQEERDSLNSRLNVELERDKVNAQTEKELREENSRLHDLLNTSLSLSENLQSSLDLSQFDSSGIQTPSSSPSRLAVKLQGSPPTYSPLTQFASPATEVLHLKQLLAEGRQTCLKLERQHAQDRTEMAKIQGSLQALVRIQDHLSSENKSVSQSFSAINEEREAYKQEAMKLSSELVGAHGELEMMNGLMTHFKENLIGQLEDLVGQAEVGSNLHTSLNEYLGELEECSAVDSLKILDSILETLCGLLSQLGKERGELEQYRTSLTENLKDAEMDGEQKMKDMRSLEEKVIKVCKQVEELEIELEKRGRIAVEKEDELTECRREIERLRQVESDKERDNTVMEDYKKDMDAQYQAKLKVLREKLIEREEEVSALKTSEQELRECLQLTEEALNSMKTDLEVRRDEEQELRDRLTRYETTLRTEVVLLDNEVQKQIDDLTDLRKGSEDLEEARKMTVSINNSQHEQLTKCTNQISQLQAEVEMLRAKKTVISKYLLSHESSRDEQTEREREELIQENDQLLMENEDLRQELSSLSETTQHLNEVVEILKLRLEEVQEEYGEQQMKLMDEERIVELRDTTQVMLELERARDELRHRCNLLETDLETERVKVRRVEREKDMVIAENRTLEGQVTIAEDRRREETRVLEKRVQEKDETLASLQNAIESVVAEKELLERKLGDSLHNKSLDSSVNTSNKVNKLKVKLKQQIKQTNHLRMKLGYCLSELRLHKQLKTELDTQITELQNALTLSQQQYRQCLEKLLMAERLAVRSLPFSTHREV